MCTERFCFGFTSRSAYGTRSAYQSMLSYYGVLWKLPNQTSVTCLWSARLKILIIKIVIFFSKLLHAHFLLVRVNFLFCAAHHSVPIHYICVTANRMFFLFLDSTIKLELYSSIVYKYALLFIVGSSTDARLLDR